MDIRPRLRRVLRYAPAAWILTISMVFGTIVNAQDSAPASTDAKAPITSGCESDFPPFCIVDPDGEANGFSVELLRAALTAMGRNVTFRTGSWPDVRGWLERGEIQALPLVGRTPERESLFDFTFPYITMQGAIVVRNDTNDIRKMADLRGRNVAVMKGDNAEEFLRREDRGIQIVTTASFENALLALSEGRCDAVVMQRLVALRLIQETGLANLQVINKPLDEFSQEFCFAVHEGDRETLALLNEGLALVMADGTYRYLHAKWFAALELPMHRHIVVGGDYNYPPYEYLDENGQPAGYDVDLTRAIARELGLDIEIRLRPWAEILDGLAQGEIDAVQGMFYSPERDQLFDFTPPHAVNHCVSVVRTGEGAPPTMVAELAGKDIVVQRGDIMHDFAVDNGLTDRLTTVDSQEDALRELASGKHDCALVARMSALYWAKKNGWNNLRVGYRPLISPGYCYAVPNGHDALLAEFTEGLNVLKDSGEYQRIYDKWLGVYREEPVTLLTALRYSAMVLAPLLLILLLVFGWSWSLRKQVAHRTADLQKSEELQRAIVECSPVALFSIDLHGTVLMWNASAQRMLGWAADEVIGKPLPTIPEGKEEEFAFHRSQVANGQSFINKEIVRRKRDGSLFDGSLSSAPIRDSNGTIIGILTVMEDITERKQAVTALADRERQLATLMGNLPGMAYRCRNDADWTVLFVSDGAYELTGYRPEELQDNARVAYGNLVHPEDRDRVWKEVQSAIAESRPFILEYRITDANGDVRWVWERGLAVTPAGDDRILEGFISDITYRKHAEDRVDHLNRVLRAVRDVNQLIVRERDRDALIQQACRLLVDHRSYNAALIVLTDNDGRPHAWSEAGMGNGFPALAEMLERGELPACCASARDTDAPCLIADRDAICGDCPERGDDCESDTLCVRLAYSDTVYGHLAATLPHDIGQDAEERELFADLAGDLAYALNVMADRAARARAEQDREDIQKQLFQAQKMEAVGQLAGGVAHDFNNILQAMMGYTQMLVDTAIANGDPCEELEEINKGIDRAATLTRQLLAFSRRQIMQPLPMDLNAVIEDMLRMLRRVIGEHIRLAWLPGNHVGQVYADVGMMEQILMNLCLNGRDAMPDGGDLTIETQNVLIDSEYCANHAWAKPGRFVLLTVTDTGCGMNPETLDRAFEPFFTTKGEGKGTGLGLATVYGIIQQHEGMISAYSEEGTGSTFKVYLPLCERKAETVGSLIEGPVTGGTETILIAEDDEMVRGLAVKVLERAGYTVLTARNGEEAVERFKQHKDDVALLVLDVMMPKTSGHDALLRIHAIRPGVPALFSSGYSEMAVHTNFVLHEGLKLLPKPYAPAALLRAVRNALDQA